MAASTLHRNLQRRAVASNGGLSEEIREQAVERLNKKREFHAHVLVYVLVNALMVGIWAILSGVHSDFWPAYLMVIWGFWIGMDAMELYLPSPIRFVTELLYARKPLSDRQVRREAVRLQRHQDKIRRDAARLRRYEDQIHGGAARLRH